MFRKRNRTVIVWSDNGYLSTADIVSIRNFLDDTGIKYTIVNPVCDDAAGVCIVQYKPDVTDHINIMNGLKDLNDHIKISNTHEL